MSDPIVFSGIFLVMLSVLIFTRWPPVRIFVAGLLATYFLGFVSVSDILNKLVSPGLVCLILLLLISVGIERLDWLKKLASSLIDQNYHLSLFRLGLITAFFSAVVNNTAVVAALTQTIKTNVHQRPSRLLIPLSYMAILGGTTTLIGTSTNLIVSSFLEEATGKGLAFFDFFLVGIVATLFGFVALLLTARFLPHNDVPSRTSHDYLIEMKVLDTSSLVGKSIVENNLRDLAGLYLVEISRGRRLLSPVSRSEVVLANDVLIFSGDIVSMSNLEQFDGLELYAEGEGLLRDTMLEAILTPDAPILGKSLREVGFRARFDAAAVAFRRGGKRLSGKLGNIPLQAGDSLMLAVGPEFHSRRNVSKNFFLMEESLPAKSSSLALSVAFYLVVAGVIFLIAGGFLSLLKGLVTLLLVMLLSGLVTPADLRRRFPFEIWLLIGSALVIAQGLENTGVAEMVSEGVFWRLSGSGVYPAFIGLYLTTVLLTECMTNNAAAAIAFPLGYGLARSFGVDPMPFVMGVAFGASASFMTPYGYTTNLIVQNLGGYRLSDYAKIGFPVVLVYSLVVIWMVPRVFPF